MTEDDPGIASENPPTMPLVNRDSATRRAGRLSRHEVVMLTLNMDSS